MAVLEKAGAERLANNSRSQNPYFMFALRPHCAGVPLARAFVQRITAVARRVNGAHLLVGGSGDPLAGLESCPTVMGQSARVTAA
ncbi:MAG TPA: hypothetical protein VN893_18825 [Bryobacteraceae bacterium]|nr:hypothetical protein [Bryobacteraceae bacterium]